VPKGSKTSTDVELERVGDHEWRFRFPRLDRAVYDEFHAALELMDEGELADAAGSLRKLVKRFPEFIDARHHLAIVLQQSYGGPGVYDWRDAVKVGLQVLPPEFVVGRDRLEWGWLDNRPFLRAYHGLALAELADDRTGEALAICQDLLDLNPNDNQGVRTIAANLLFARRRPDAVLALCDRYPMDGLPAMSFGRVLALYMLDREDEAAAALRKAAEHSPLVAKELTKKTHPEPRSRHPGFITMGGADEAYDYWREAGGSWKRAPGALEFVRRTMGVRETKA